MTNILRKFLLNLSYELSDEVMVMWGMRCIMPFTAALLLLRTMFPLIIKYEKGMEVTTVFNENK